MEGVQAKPETQQSVLEPKPSLAKKQKQKPSLAKKQVVPKPSLAKKQVVPNDSAARVLERKPFLAKKQVVPNDSAARVLGPKPSLAKKLERKPSLAKKQVVPNDSAARVLERKPSLAKKKQERKPSLAKKKQVVPKDIATSKLTRVLEDLKSYQVDCEDDTDLQDFDARLRAGAEKVKRSKGFDLLKNCLMYLTLPDKKIASEISAYLQKILEAKGQTKAMRAYETHLDHLMPEYLKNSRLTLQLCRKELPDFIKSAREVHSCIADVVCDRQKWMKLDKAKQKYHQCAEAVVAKVKSLQNRHAAMLDKLKKRVQELDKKLDLARTLKRVLNVMFIGILSGLFVCTIMAAAMAAPPVASALTPWIAGLVAGGAVAYPVFKEGRHWLFTLIEGYKSTLEAQKRLLKSMEAGTGDVIKELDGIMRLVKRIIEKGEDPVIIKGKLADFDREIKELDERTKECLTNTEKSREQVLKEYGNVKKSDVWNTEIKK